MIHLVSIWAHDKAALLHRTAQAASIHLTRREIECLKWVGAGWSDWEIGEKLHISRRTVNTHIESAKRKYGVTTRVQAVILAARDGAISL